MNTERPTILITGATDGLGFAVARVLAEQGAHLILHGRNAEKLEHLTKTLRSEIPNLKVETELADFESLRQVDQMATLQNPYRTSISASQNLRRFCLIA